MRPERARTFNETPVCREEQPAFLFTTTTAMPVVRDFAGEFRLPNKCGGTDAIILIHEVRRPDVDNKFVNELSISAIKCGMVFNEAITVVEPRSLNPALRILTPVGITLIMAIINHITGESILQPLEPPDEDNLPF